MLLLLLLLLLVLLEGVQGLAAAPGRQLVVADGVAGGFAGQGVVTAARLKLLLTLLLLTVLPMLMPSQRWQMPRSPLPRSGQRRSW